jgi:deazaflavin-dependent oxidoreductase (nitroreductase family)
MASTAGVPHVDPLAKRGFVHKGMSAFLRTKAGRSTAINVAARVDPYLLKASRGYVALGMVLPSANLTTKGAKSGAKRTSTVLYFTEGDDVILVASSFGRDKHPAWYHNLKVHPEATLERAGRSGRYIAAEVEDEAERQRLFTLMDKIYAGYADYRKRADEIGRRIPILRLTPAP